MYMLTSFKHLRMPPCTVTEKILYYEKPVVKSYHHDLVGEN